MAMNQERFNEIIQEQVNTCLDTLVVKAKEYATDDKLHNFRTAASLHGGTMEQALAGMMAKHTVSVYDMCNSGQVYNLNLWNEKITDSINYLLLLRAVVGEVD